MTTRREKWIGAAWTLVGLVVIVLAAPDLWTGGSDTTLDVSVELENEGVEVPRGADEVWSELARDVAVGSLDLAGAKTRLAEERLAINLDLIIQSAQSRAQWFANLQQSVQRLLLVSLLLLFGPIWLARKRPPGERRTVALRATPYFVAATAALLSVGAMLIGAVMGIHSVQVTFASLAAVKVSVTDALIHYIVYSDDPGLDRLFGVMFTARDQPLGALGLIDHLLLGVQAAQESRILGHAYRMATWLGRGLELYVPLIAVGAVALAVQTAIPVVRETLSYPAQAIGGQVDGSLWIFAKRQFALVWREIRITLWMFLYVMLFVIGLTVAVRLLSYGLVAVWIDSLLATNTILDSGQALPDATVLVSLVGGGLFFAAATLALVAPAGRQVSYTYLLLRHRATHRQRFRDYPEYWRQARSALFRRIPLTILAVVIVLAGYVVLAAVIESPWFRLWLPAVVLAPGLPLVMWGFRLLRRDPVWRPKGPDGGIPSDGDAPDAGGSQP